MQSDKEITHPSYRPTTDFEESGYKVTVKFGLHTKKGSVFFRIQSNVLDGPEIRTTRTHYEDACMVAKKHLAKLVRLNQRGYALDFPEAAAPPVAATPEDQDAPVPFITTQPPVATDEQKNPYHMTDTELAEASAGLDHPFVIGEGDERRKTVKRQLHMKRIAALNPKHRLATAVKIGAIQVLWEAGDTPDNICLKAKISQRKLGDVLSRHGGDWRRPKGSVGIPRKLMIGARRAELLLDAAEGHLTVANALSNPQAHERQMDVIAKLAVTAERLAEIPTDEWAETARWKLLKETHKAIDDLKMEPEIIAKVKMIKQLAEVVECLQPRAKPGGTGPDANRPRGLHINIINGNSAIPPKIVDVTPRVEALPEEAQA